MTVPRNVLWFEVLMYASLFLDALTAAFGDRTPPDAETTETMMMANSLITACLILLFAFLVGLAARRRKNWARWVLIASLVFSVLSLVLYIGEKGLQFDSGMQIVSCLLGAAGLYFSFTGDARGWFNA
jgi:hypothetical protein